MMLSLFSSNRPKAYLRSNWELRSLEGVRVLLPRSILSFSSSVAEQIYLSSERMILGRKLHLAL